MKKIIIFMGPMGSGKGTQAKIAAKLLSIPNLSTGDLLREIVKSGSKLGKEISNMIDKGELVSNDLMLDILKNRISADDCKDGFILDGYPRTLEQAEILEEFFDKSDLKITNVILINVDDETLIKRITGRYMCKKCGAIYNKYFKNPKIENVCDICSSKEFETRIDDADEEAQRKRLSYYKENSKKIIDFYNKKNLIYLIDGLKDIEAISFDIKNILLKN